MNFLISKDRNYILLGNKIASLKENKSFKIKDLHVTEVIDIFESQSIKLIEQDSSKINEINSIIRGLGNIISEELTGDESKTFLIELELKLNNNLITESVDDVKVLMEGVWSWIKDKAGRVWGGIKQGTKFVAKKVWNGVKWVGGKMAEALTWLVNKGFPWFFDHLREFVYSPLGIGIEVALQATGVGEIPLLVVFGALLCWEIYELISKGPSFWRVANVIFAALGCIPGATLLIRGVKPALKAVETAKGLKGATRGFFEKAINMVTKGIGGILSVMKRGIKWVAGIFGKGAVRWVDNVLSGAERKILGATESVSKKIGTKRGAMALSKGLRAFIIWSGVNWGIHEFLKTETGKKFVVYLMKKFGYGGGDSSKLPQGVTVETLVSDENIKMVLEECNPELKPITSLTIVRDEKDPDNVKKYIINGKEYKDDPNEKIKLKVIPYQDIYSTNTSTNTINNTNSTLTQPVKKPVNKPVEDWSDLDDVAVAL